MVQKTLLAAIVLSMSACGGAPIKPTPPPPPPMTQAEANSFATSLIAVTGAAMTACYNKANFHPNGFGTFPINISCDATRSCNGGGSIRPSITGTGQFVVNQTSATLKVPLQGSQNILDWGCAGNYIISGNPTVSLTGELFGSTNGTVQNYINQSGQIIYGPRGGAPSEQRFCSVNIQSIETNTTAFYTTGTICGRTINQ